MALEIERKFLVDKSRWRTEQKPPGILYEQGYISTDLAKTVRVRIGREKAYLTVKGNNSGPTRLEFEYEIPSADAMQLLEQFCSSKISKYRYELWYKGKMWEVDEFLGDNEGLIVAEIELTSETESFDCPAWAIQEVTGDERYYNSGLAVYPYKKWNRI